MWNRIKSLLRSQPPDERVMELERQVQSLRLDLTEQEQLAARLRKELERQRSGASNHVAEAVQAQVEQLLADAATPVAQLLTQAHLLETEGRPVQAKDALAVAKRLVRTLEDHGLAYEGHVGETVPFDPDRHEPLSTDAFPRPGQTVVVRFVGVSYQGKLLRKAGVEHRTMDDDTAESEGVSHAGSVGR
jgi:molecular chaperone GrpE (heat shock protein)